MYYYFNTMYIYKINTSLTKEQSEKIFDELTPKEIRELNSYKLLAKDIEVDHKMISYIITDRSTIVRILLFLRRKNLKFFFEDVSEDILFGKTTFDGEFGEKIKIFIKNNLNIDNILDKISKFGINSLSKLDKEFLNIN